MSQGLKAGSDSTGGALPRNILAMALRRLALLPDNDRFLRRELARIQKELPPLLRGKVAAALVIGSVAEGQAGDSSDIDILLVLDEGMPRRADYRFWDEQVAPRAGRFRFPVQPIFIGRGSVRTSEPNLAAAIRRGILLWDQAGLFPRRKRWSTAS